MNRGQGRGGGRIKQAEAGVAARILRKMIGHGRARFVFACVPLSPLFMPMTMSSLKVESGVIASPMTMRTSSPRLVVGVASLDCCQVLEAGG